MSSPQKTFYIETFGCQMNFHDSEKVVGTLISEGYAQVQREEDADLIVYNTCSIRDKAEQKVFIQQSARRDAPHDLRAGGAVPGAGSMDLHDDPLERSSCRGDVYGEAHDSGETS